MNGELLTDQKIVSILRNWTGGDLGSIALCVGVLMRIDNPFVSNRRLTKCPVHISGQDIPAGAKIQLNWTSENRDQAVFDNNQFDSIKNADKNLVYGIGKHACPGQLPEREVAPVGGYHRVPVILS